MNPLRNLIAFFKSLHLGSRHDPTRDWLALITMCAIILVGIMAWSGWTFHTVAGGGVIGKPPARTIPTVTRSSLEEIETIFTARKEEQVKYTTGTYRFVDPSQ